MRSFGRILTLCSLAGGIPGCDAEQVSDFPGLVALCTDESATNCPCSGALLTSTQIVSAKHCADSSASIPVRFAVFNRPDDFSTGEPDDVVRIVRRCTQDASTDSACNAIVNGTDLDLYTLEHSVSNTPVRLSTPDDRTAVDGQPSPSYTTLASRTGQFRMVPVGSPQSCVVSAIGGDIDYGEPLGTALCFTPGASPEPLSGNDSGSPLFVVNRDGEAALTGIHNGGQGGLDLFTDLHAFREYLPASSRPPFLIDPDFLFPWRRQCEWPLPNPLLISMMAEASDFDGDGQDDGFFADEDGQPFIMPAGAETPQAFEYSGENLPYPMSYLGVDVLDAEGSELVGIDPDGVLRVARLEGELWIADEFAPIDLLAFDDFWGGADLRYEFETGHFSVDPLLRAGDLDGDGRSDLLATLQETLVVLRHDGQQWEPTAVPLDTLGVPNEPMYRETLALADVSQGWPGDELLVRRPCGLAVFGFDGQSFVELSDQACGEEPWVLSDEHGFDVDNLWRYGVGNLDGDVCDDIVVRTNGAVYQLFADCENQMPQFQQGPDTGLVFRGRVGAYEGWSHGLEGALRLADIDGDGLDDIIANSPSGPQVHINQNDQQAPFAMVGGLDPEQSSAVRPHLEIDDWSLLTIGRFDAEHVEFISLRSTLACLELWWLFD